MISIKKKIKALLSKTVENGASPMESESAIQKANELMLKYYISMHDIKDLDIEETIITKSIPIIFKKTKLNMLYPALCKLFECNHYYTKDFVTFVGYESDVDIIEYLFVYINHELVNRLTKFKCSEFYLDNRKYLNGNSLVSNFIKGYTIALRSKIYDLFNDREEKLSNYSNVTALMHTKKQKVDAFMFSKNVRITRTPTLHVNNTKSFDAGYDEGMDTNLVKAITNNKNTTQID